MSGFQVRLYYLDKRVLEKEKQHGKKQSVQIESPRNRDTHNGCGKKGRIIAGVGTGIRPEF
jgi:hypothetical protein